VQLPEHLSFVEAATLPRPRTAWNALAAGNLKPGATVFDSGNRRGLHLCLQLAKLMGARVLGISSSAAKLERARSLGLDARPQLPRNPAWERWAMDQTGGEALTWWSRWAASARCLAPSAPFAWRRPSPRSACLPALPTRCRSPSSSTSRHASRASTWARARISRR